MLYYPTPQAPWFCDDPDGEGRTYWPTEAEAIAQARQCIREWLCDGEEWPTEVNYIIVGKVMYRATQTHIVRPVGPLDEDGFDEEGDYYHGPDDYTCDYEMRTIEDARPQEPNP